MASNPEPTTAPHDPLAAKAALDMVTTDRADIANRFTAQTRWAAPAQGAAAALAAAAPGAGMPWMLVLSAAAVTTLVVVERQFRARTGLAISRPAGPIGMLVLVLVTVVLVGGPIGSLALSLSGAAVWIPLVVVAVFVLTTLLAIVYDRVYAREVRRVR